MSVSGFSGRRSPRRRRPLPKEIPTDDDRRGPVPPPPRTAHAPGVTVCSVRAIPAQYLLRLDEGNRWFLLGRGKRARVRGSRCSCSLAAPRRRLALPSLFLVRGNFQKSSPAPPSHRARQRRGSGRSRESPASASSRVSRRPDSPCCGSGRHRARGGSFADVRAFAVFSGRFTAFDGDEVKEMSARALWHASRDPSATLYLEAGNDAALAVALAADRLRRGPGLTRRRDYNGRPNFGGPHGQFQNGPARARVRRSPVARNSRRR